MTCQLIYLHPDLSTYLKYLKEECCQNNNCSLDGPCLKHLKYLAERCGTHIQRNLNKIIEKCSYDFDF